MAQKKPGCAMKLGIQEAAKLLSVSEKTIYRWVRGGLLPVYRVNGQYRFHRQELLAWAISRRMNVPEEVFHDSLRVTGVIPTLAEAVQRGGIYYRVQGSNKEDALRFVIEATRLGLQVESGYLLNLMLAREGVAPTAVGEGVAIPQLVYPNSLELECPMVALAFLEEPIDFDSFDGLPVQILFCLFSASLRGYHILLNRLYYALRDPALQSSLRVQAGREELLAHFARIESGLRKSVASEE